MKARIILPANIPHERRVCCNAARADLVEGKVDCWAGHASDSRRSARATPAAANNTSGTAAHNGEYQFNRGTASFTADDCARHCDDYDVTDVIV